MDCALRFEERPGTFMPGGVGAPPRPMVAINLVYGATCAAAFAGAAWLAHRAWHRAPLGPFGTRLLLGAAAGIGLSAGLAGAAA